MEYKSDAEATRSIKAALRKAFPNTKTISITRGGSHIEWTDDGPTVEQVKDALIAANVVTTWKDFRDDLVLQASSSHSSIWFDRYNIAERAAYQQDQARRIEESEQRRQRENDAVREASNAKHAALKRPPSDGPKLVETGVEVFTAFEQLRQRAENDVAADEDAERSRRPSWAPPLIIEGELLAVCIELGLLTADDKPIARLWAEFADPKKRGRALRKWDNPHGMSEITCRGFELHPGTERGSTSDILFQAQREASGAWRFGPYFYESDYHSPRRSDWERLVTKLVQARDAGEPSLIEQISAQIAEIDERDRKAAVAYYRRQQLRKRAAELGRDRALDFAGAPGVQMQLAARLSGMCFNCGKALTDPSSLERGIGPECHAGKVKFIRRMADDGRNIPSIASLAGMPEDFVTAVLAEPRPKPKPTSKPPASQFPTFITGGYEIAEIGDKFAVLNPEHTDFLSMHATKEELFAWIDEQRRAQYAERRHD